jgi:enolase
MTRIVDLIAREILDSRGNPTIEVDCVLETGHIGRAATPSGALTGAHEANGKSQVESHKLQVRDFQLSTFNFQLLHDGVQKAIRNVRELILPRLRDAEVVDHGLLDRKLMRLDLTGNKSHLGANAMLAVSMASCRAGAAYLGIPLYAHLGGSKESLLPVPMLSVIAGGVHAPNKLDLRGVMIVPAGTRSFAEALRCAAEVYHTLKKILAERKLATTVADEGGFAPDCSSNEEPLKFITDAIGRAGYQPGKDAFIALDPAASETYQDGKYHLTVDGKTLTAQEITQMYAAWVEKYPIISIENGLAQDDWDGWKHLTQVLGKKIQLVGDDIFVTNVQRLKQGIESGVANAVTIKPNQIGTVTETLECIELAKKSGYRTVISHRSGETEDTFIADLAVATNAGQIEAGAPCRSDRTAKYNQLLRIEQEIKGRFAGMSVYQPGTADERR